MAKSFKPLTDEELKEMHGKLREQFEYASKMMVKWKEAGYYNDQNTTSADHMVNGYKLAAPIATAMASTAEAMVAIERELKERDEQSPIKLPKPKTP